MIFIFGAAGFAKEVDWLLYDLYRVGNFDGKTDFFVCEDDGALVGQFIGDTEVIGEALFFDLTKDQSGQHQCLLGVGNPKVRKKIVENIKRQRNNVTFPTLIHPSVQYDKREGRVRIGEGGVICSGVSLTSDIQIGDFVHINLDCTVGHDSVIDSYCTLSPGVHVSGNVKLGEGGFIGTGASLIENVNIVASTVVGAGAVVTKNLMIPGTYVGAPAQIVVRKKI